MKRNKDVFSECIVGIFMLAVLALLAYFTIVISGVDVLSGRQRTPCQFTFQDVGGLKERDNVIYRGMKVGTVEKIILSPSNILVQTRIDHEVILRAHARASVAALSLLGGNYLLIEEGTGAIQDLQSTTFPGESPTDWMRDLSEIAKNISALTSDGSVKSILTNAEAVTKNVNTIVARVQRGEGTVGRLLSSDETTWNDITNTISSIRSTFDRAGTLVQRLDSVAERLARGEGTLGQLLSKDDGGLLNDVRTSLQNVRTVTTRLTNEKGLLARLSSDESLAQDARTLVSNLRDVSEKLAQGKGTLGRLTTDDGLYTEMNTLIHEMKGLIQDVRQVVDNYRDTTPITTFGALATGAL